MSSPPLPPSSAPLPPSNPPPAPPPGPIDLYATVIHAVLLLIFILTACVLFQQLLGATPRKTESRLSHSDTGRPDHNVAVGRRTGRLVTGRGASKRVAASDVQCWCEDGVAASAAQLLVEADAAAAAAAARGPNGEAASGHAAVTEAAPSSPSSCARIPEEASDDAAPTSGGDGATAVVHDERATQAGTMKAAARRANVGHHKQPPAAANFALAEPAAAKAVVRLKLAPLPSEQPSAKARAHDLD